MHTTLEARTQRLPSLNGLPVLRSGHRLFFLGVGLSGALSVVAWLAAWRGLLQLDAAWHGHEMIWGFAAAAIGGFLTAAVPKWTRSRLFQGAPAAALFGLWLAGRVAMWSGVATWVDLLFLPVMAGVVFRRLLKARNRRNFQVAGLVLALAAMNGAWHLGHTTEAMRAAVLLVVALIALIAGRIVPGFTRNAVVRAGGDGSGITRSEGLERWVVPGVVAAAAVELVAPLSLGAGVLALALALLLALRARSWGFRQALRWPIVWVMHVAWWFVPLGFALSGLAALGVGVDPFAALHAHTAGAIGGMILAVASRAARGHAGLPLVASRWTVATYLCVLAGAVVRVFGGRGGMMVAGTLWAVGWALFAAEHAPMLLRARRDGMPG